jgi:DNA-binding PadR family transcriptional regulator
VTQASTTTYALLGMLAVRSWTGYELTQQLRRSLRFVWPSSEGHLYREQKRLVELGWATVETERAGGRRRNRYRATDAGLAALGEWLASPVQEPHLEVEGVLRLFHGTSAAVPDLAASLRASARQAGAMLDEMLGFVEEYLSDDGPLAMLEAGVGGPEQERLEFGGRVQYPERLHVVALVIDVTTRLLADLGDFFAAAADEVSRWESTTTGDLLATRHRLEHIRERHRGSSSLD